MHRKSAAAVIERLKAITSAKSDAELASCFGISPQTLSSWKSRDSVPYAICVDFAETRGISLDWLLTGEGPIRRDEGAPAVAAEAPAAPGISPREQAMLELFRSLDEDGQREIQSVAAEKKRLSTLEQRIKELSAALEAVKKQA